MKNIFLKSFAASVAMLFAGCANMPADLKGLPSSLGNAVPAGGKLGSNLDKVVDVAKSANEATRAISEEEEIAIGEKVMTGVLGAAPLYANDRIQRYVNQVGRWIASRSERPNLPWRFAVIDSPLANAGAAPGGQIYITTGLLFRMRSEAELAGALAHEIAHVVQKHHLRTYQTKVAANAAKNLAASELNARTKVGGGAVGQAVKGAVIEFGMEGVSTMLLTPLDRSEEEQADRMGMIMAARAGYDPYGLPTVLQILQDILPEQGGASILFSTHPSPASRIASLDSALGKSMEQYGSQATLRDRFVANILGTSASSAPTVPSVSAPTAKPAAKVPSKPVGK
jgi:beta-barrel assembly-enhancing protease